MFLFLIACLCSPYGSVRNDCEQMSGKCICKPGIIGDKCDRCPDGTQIQPKGCDEREFFLEYLSNVLYISNVSLF